MSRHPRLRRRRCDDFADGMVIIVARKSNEPEVVGRQQCFFIERFDAVAHLGNGMIAAGRLAHDDANLAAPAKRHQHTAAGDGGRTIGRRQIVEFTRQWHANGNV